MLCTSETKKYVHFKFLRQPVEPNSAGTQCSVSRLSIFHVMSNLLNSGWDWPDGPVCIVYSLYRQLEHCFPVFGLKKDIDG